MGEIVRLHERNERAQEPVWLPAVIRIPGAQSLAATVTELAPDGACIDVPPVPLPGFFLMEIAGGEAIERICRVVWREERRVGVRFVNARTMGRSRSGPRATPEPVALHAVSRSTVTAASNSARR
jgi:PilZ domain